MLIITDNQGVPLSCSNPISGNHIDAYDLAKTVDKIMRNIQESNIQSDWLFLNADAGFDTKEFLSYCFETNEIHWKVLNLLAFCLYSKLTIFV